MFKLNSGNQLPFLTKISALIVLLLFASCEDEIQLEINSAQPSIVIYGEINNGNGPYRIRIQKPTNYGSQTVRDFNAPPIENAKVTISDNADNAETLMEEFPGVYVTKKNGIRGIVGRKYTLTVEALGKKYISKTEILPEPPVVEKVYNEFNNAQKPYDFGHNVFIKIKDKPAVANNYLVRSTSFNEFMLDQPECYGTCPPIYLRCWKYKHGSENVLINDKLVDGKTITQYIDFAPMDEIVDYAMYISVANGSRDLYNYWLRMDEQSKISGSIFDKQPAQISGNIRGTNGEEVLGYFAVSGVKQIQYKFNRFNATPLDKATELVAYNADFRPRIKQFDCRKVFYWEWNEKTYTAREYRYPNNIGDQLPDWWRELDKVE